MCILYFLEKTPRLLYIYFSSTVRPDKLDLLFLISARFYFKHPASTFIIAFCLGHATIYFSATVMRRLFEGGCYSKYRRRGYYLFQLYRNAATIRGRLLFKVQTSRILFISALPQCGDYSRAAAIQSTDVAATIYFSSTAMRRLFEGGCYSKYRRRGYYLFQLYRNAATIQGRLLFKVQTPRLLFILALPQCGDYSRAGHYSKYRCRGYYLFQLYHNAATI